MCAEVQIHVSCVTQVEEIYFKIIETLKSNYTDWTHLIIVFLHYLIHVLTVLNVSRLEASAVCSSIFIETPTSTTGCHLFIATDSDSEDSRLWDAKYMWTLVF